MEGKEIVNDNRKIATIMNRCFTNITKHVNLKANKINQRKKLVNILDKFKNHMSVQRIKLANFQSYSTLNFSKVTESKVRKEILNLSSKKATKNGDISAKILKKNVDVYIKEITFIISDCIENRISLMTLNWLMYHPYLKRKVFLKKNIINRLAYYHSFQKSLKGSFINKLILSFILIYAVLEKTITLNIYI